MNLSSSFIHSVNMFVNMFVNISVNTPWYFSCILMDPFASQDVQLMIPRWWEEETRWPGHLLIAVHAMDAAAYCFAEAIPSFPLHNLFPRGQVIQVLDSLSDLVYSSMAHVHKLCLWWRTNFNQFLHFFTSFAILVISGCGDFWVVIVAQSIIQESHSWLWDVLSCAQQDVVLAIASPHERKSRSAQWDLLSRSP